VIDKGEADFIVSFELLEAARWTEYLKPGGKIVVNTQEISPMPVITGAAQYPEDIEGKLSAVANVTALDALSLAEQAGSAKAVNVVLIGLMAKNTDIPYEKWVETVKTTVPAKFLEINLKAFDLGYHHE
jgi:indolepyruvate ferredoxin oxidoreductase beta subunit